MKKIFVCAAMAMVFALNGRAQEVKDSVPAIPSEMSMMQVAGQLVKYGYEKGEALPIIQAVEIYQNLGGKSLQAPKAEEVGTQVVSGEKDSRVSFDINQLLADATELADGNANLIGLINGLKNSATRGATTNYDIHVDRVKAHSTDVYNVRFYGGETAVVVVSGDGDTDLDLYIYNSNGRLVASDTDYTDDCVCSWVPSYTSTYTIKIVNRGPVYNQYRMAIN